MLKVCQLHTDFNAIVSPKIFTQHIWAILNKNTHTCERYTVKIDEMEIIQDILIDKLTLFTH